MDPGRPPAGRPCRRDHGGPLRRRPAAAAEDHTKASAFSERSSARRSGFTTLRHRDGRGIGVRLWLQPQYEQDGPGGWVPAAEAAALSWWATGGSGAQSLPGALHLPSRLPVGVVVRDTQGIEKSWSRASIRPSVHRASTLCSGIPRVTDR
ncbi:hypothetical protein [Streptomyces sp. NPDC001820]|uniref:hypothetical protein n=1 Tax=Streptomyces sp. NPDC001820 TaxID=3364613 RepID=UPI0036B17E06